ncbi:hypothetical protein K9L27_00435 [Candidatus Gracilibacteria bacterium]|nr:hypothetical protein [Candidatus Gracilibacteria bacterium]
MADLSQKLGGITLMQQAHIEKQQAIYFILEEGIPISIEIKPNMDFEGFLWGNKINPRNEILLLVYTNSPLAQKHTLDTVIMAVSMFGSLCEVWINALEKQIQIFGFYKISREKYEELNKKYPMVFTF